MTYTHVDGGITYTVQEFNVAGAFTWTPPVGVFFYDALVVAGGGGGGNHANGGGGGGAGGCRWVIGRSCTPGVGISGTVGAGGATQGTDNNPGNNGSNSSLGSDSVIGGGGGVPTGGTAYVGGSGGGGIGGGAGVHGPGGAGTSGEGNAGGMGRGDANQANRRAGGGGGKGSVGETVTGSIGGDGGSGIDLSAQLGTGVGEGGWFASGGGGGSATSSFPGGNGPLGGGGQGGRGSNTGSPSVAGQPNTGGGGGGGGGSADGTQTPGRSGGRGVVIVRYVARPIFIGRKATRVSGNGSLTAEAAGVIGDNQLLMMATHSSVTPNPTGGGWVLLGRYSTTHGKASFWTRNLDAGTLSATIPWTSTVDTGVELRTYRGGDVFTVAGNGVHDGGVGISGPRSHVSPSRVVPANNILIRVVQNAQDNASGGFNKTITPDTNLLNKTVNLTSGPAWDYNWYEGIALGDDPVIGGTAPTRTATVTSTLATWGQWVDILLAPPGPPITWGDIGDFTKGVLNPAWTRVEASGGTTLASKEAWTVGSGLLVSAMEAGEHYRRPAPAPGVAFSMVLDASVAVGAAGAPYVMCGAWLSDARSAAGSGHGIIWYNAPGDILRVQVDTGGLYGSSYSAFTPVTRVGTTLLRMNYDGSNLLTYSYSTNSGSTWTPMPSLTNAIGARHASSYLYVGTVSVGTGPADWTIRHADLSSDPPPVISPGPPTGLAVSLITPTSMRLTWVGPTTGAAVDTYYTSIDGSIPHDNGPLLYDDFTGLTPNTEYDLGVASGSYTQGTSAEVGITASTLPLPLPGVPGIVSATVTSLTATLLWATPTSGGPVDTYQVRIDGGAPATETSPHVFTGLTPETEYDLEVRAVNATGPSAWALATVTTATPDPPTITIGWDAVASDDDLVGYEVALDGAVWDNTGPGTRVYSFTGLNFDTTYSLTARALGHHGLNSEWSEPLVETTPELT